VTASAAASPHSMRPSMMARADSDVESLNRYGGELSAGGHGEAASSASSDLPAMLSSVDGDDDDEEDDDDERLEMLFDEPSQSSLRHDLMLVEEHIRPLIKEELRYSIQSKRMAKGLPDIVNLDRKETVFDVVSPETRKKRERRRERNKIAAAKCRFKKKLLSEKLEQESERLETLNYQLQREVRQLHDEKEKLVYILNMHMPSCNATAESLSSSPQLQPQQQLAPPRKGGLNKNENSNPK